MTHSTNPPAPQASAAEQMRESAAKTIMDLIHDHDCTVFPDKIAYNCAIVDAAAHVRALPLPPDPHAAQIAALTEALAKAKAELANECRVTKRLYDRLDRIGHYRAMIERTMRGEYDDDARIDATQGQPT